MIPGWHHGVLRGSPGAAARTVVKFGGSLFARSAWPDELRAILAACGPRVAVVVGGGPLVDALRAMDAASPRPAAEMHWLAIDAMTLTATLVARAVGTPLVTDPFERAAAGVLDVRPWLQRSPAAQALPEGWQVTSDSIAAAVAHACAADLVLAKSLPPPVASLDGLAAVGWVDEHCPTAAAAVGCIAWLAPAVTASRRLSPTSSR